MLNFIYRNFTSNKINYDIGWCTLNPDKLMGGAEVISYQLQDDIRNKLVKNILSIYGNSNRSFYCKENNTLNVKSSITKLKLPYNLKLILCSYEFMIKVKFLMLKHSIDCKLGIFQHPFHPFRLGSAKNIFWFHTPNCLGYFDNSISSKNQNFVKTFLIYCWSSYLKYKFKRFIVIANSIYTKNIINKTLQVDYVMYPMSLQKFKSFENLYRNNRVKHKFTVGFVNLKITKGGAFLIELIKLLVDVDFIIVIGPDPDRNLVQIIMTLPNVTIFNWSSDILSFFNKIDLLLVPSVWSEPFGMLQQEASAYGINVLTSGRGGLSEIITPNVAVLNLDLDDWASSIKVIIESESYLKNPSFSFNQHIISNYSNYLPEVIIQKLLTSI